MFRDLSQFYSETTKQHNIIALIGNGFDVAAMSKYGCGKMKGKKPTYPEFYAYLTYYADANQLADNMIYKEMTEKKAIAESKNDKDKTWSDFELIIDELCKKATTDFKKLRLDLDYIQAWFSKFLNDLVTADTLIEINNDSLMNGLAIQSLSKFLGDLDSDDTMEFSDIHNQQHYDIFNFLFVDFNYSMLLDNYIYLDRYQFDPHAYKTVDRNFVFCPAPKIPGNIPGYNEETHNSTYLFTDIVHPHGYMDIPRSIIFGTELETYDKAGKDNEKMFVKSFWARDEIRYSEYIKDTELFIIFGMSITKTDAWWFDHVYESLARKNAELIIYNYTDKHISDLNKRAIAKDEAKNRFINACIKNGSDKSKNAIVKDRIFVVLMSKNDTYFLGFEKRN